MAAFAAFLGASQRVRPPRRRALVLASVLVHGGLLVAAATAGVRPAPAAPPAPEPVLVRLWSPPARPRTGPPPSAAPPRRARSAPRPRLTQPALAPVAAPPPQAPPSVADTASESSVEEPAGLPEAPPAALPASEGPLELGQVARPPAVLARVTPAYPREARRDRLEGTVVLRVIVGLDGAVERGQTKVVRSVSGLDAAAIAAIEGWRFTPALGHAGRPVRVIIEVPFQFYLR